MEYYLICYDIRCDKSRTKFAKYLRKNGFQRLQKSVFVGKIISKKALLLPNQLSAMINHAIDELCIMPISQSVVGKSVALGQSLAPCLGSSKNHHY